MRNNKQLLHYLMDIGGVATLNNLYSPKSNSYKNSLDNIRELRDYWLERKLIEKIEPFKNYRPDNPAKEEFYCLTAEGAKFIERGDEFIRRKNKKSISADRVRHESCLFDVLLSFVRLFPDYIVTIDFPLSVMGIRPDARINMTSKKNSHNSYIFYLEIERKKTIDRTFKETVEPYMKLVKRGELTKADKKQTPRMFCVLTVFSEFYTYPSFIRHQDMKGEVMEDIQRTIDMTARLASSKHYGGSLPKGYFLFMSQSDFYRLNESVWFSPDGKKVKLIQ